MYLFVLPGKLMDASDSAQPGSSHLIFVIIAESRIRIEWAVRNEHQVLHKTNNRSRRLCGRHPIDHMLMMMMMF